MSGTIAQFLVQTLQSLPPSPSERQSRDDLRIEVDPDQRISLLAAYRIWKWIDERSQRSDVGMMLGKLLTPERAALAGHLFNESRTLRDAVMIMARFPSLAVSNIDIDLQERGDDAFFHFMVRPSLLPYSVTECYLFICYYWWLRFSGRERLPIKEIRLVYAEPPHVELYHQAAPGARLLFNQEINTIHLDREVFDCINPQFSDYLRNLLIRHAEKLLQENQNQTSLSNKILVRIQHGLPHDLPTLESLASEFDMSTRNLRRRLKEEGTSFRDLLESARREIANSMLHDHGIRMEDIAFLLGYSEYSTFSRAFKKWYGLRPSEYLDRTDIGVIRKWGNTQQRANSDISAQ